MFLTIIVAVVLTGLISAMAWIAGQQSRQTSNFRQSDQAYFAAEAGLDRVLWYCKNNQMASISSPLNGTLNGYDYTTSWTTVSGNTIKITSIGSLGSISYTLCQQAAPAGVLTTVASGADFKSTSLLTLTGDLSVAGNITSSGTFGVNGNVDAAGTIDSGVTATGTKTPNDPSAPAPPSASAIYNSLLPTAYSIASGNITTLDFTGHPVLVANGNVLLKVSTVIGTGTLIVNGKVSSANDVGAAGAPLTFNIVCTGDFNANNKFYLTGSIYTGGTMSFNNLTVVTGVIAAESSINLNNHHTFTFATPPAFDPRGGGVALSNFTGPQP